MKKLITLGAMALLAVAGLCMAQDSTKVDKYAFPPLPQELKNADSLLAAGDSTQGLAKLRAIVNSKTEDEVKARAQYNIGDYYLKRNYKSGSDWKKKNYYRKLSQQEFRKVINNYPNTTMEVWAYLVLHDYEAVISKYPNTKHALVALTEKARNLGFSGRYSGALSAWKQVLKVNTDNHWACAEAMYNIAKLSPESEKENMIESMIDKYRDQESWVRRGLGMLSHEQWKAGNKQTAIDIMYREIKLYPNRSANASTLMAIYSAYNDMQEYEKAKDVKERLLREYPSSYDAFTLDPNKKK